MGPFFELLPTALPTACDAGRRAWKWPDIRVLRRQEWIVLPKIAV
jgi:hypothetical protein